MAIKYYYIDDSTEAGQQTLLNIENESGKFGCGATADLEANSLVVDGTNILSKLQDLENEINSLKSRVSELGG
jgi:hypothetical protein